VSGQGKDGGMAFATLSREERVALCQEVMEGLSDLVEGTAPPDLCERVEKLLGDCQPYQAYKNTLEATMILLGECSTGESASALSEDAFRRCVAQAKATLERQRRPKS
jgi:hypothetical protein